MRDHIFIAIMAAVTFVLGGILVPLFQLLPFAALRAVVLAPIYAGCAWVVMNGVQVRFPLILFGVVLGALVSIFTPWLFPVTFLSAVFSEALSSRNTTLKACLFPALQFPLMFIATMPVKVDALVVAIVGGITVLGIALGYMGCMSARFIIKRVIRFRALEENEIKEKRPLK